MDYANSEIAHARLLEALASAKEPAADEWIVFMDLVHSLAPRVFSVGRPSKKDIEASFIGRSGFKSWREMVEAPVEDRGLGWSWSAWVQWSRAWRTLEAQPVVMQASLSPAQVNRLAERVRKGEAAWPERPEEVKTILKAPEKPQEPLQPTADTQALLAAQARVAELEAALMAQKKASPIKRLLSWLAGFFRR